MRVQPIYQVLRATRMEPQCADDAHAANDEKGLAKIVGAVKGAVSRKPDPPTGAGQLRNDPGGARIPPPHRLRRRLRLSRHQVPLAPAVRPGQPPARACVRRPVHPAAQAAACRGFRSVASAARRCDHSRPMQTSRADADVLTSACMAAGHDLARAPTAAPTFSLGSARRRIGSARNPALALGFFVHGPAISSPQDAP